MADIWLEMRKDDNNSKITSLRLKLLDDMRSANKITKEEYESAKAILSKW